MVVQTISYDADHIDDVVNRPPSSLSTRRMRSQNTPPTLLSRVPTADGPLNLLPTKALFADELLSPARGLFESPSKGMLLSDSESDYSFASSFSDTSNTRLLESINTNESKDITNIVARDPFCFIPRNMPGEFSLMLQKHMQHSGKVGCEVADFDWTRIVHSLGEEDAALGLSSLLGPRIRATGLTRGVYARGPDGQHAFSGDGRQTGLLVFICDDGLGSSITASSLWLLNLIATIRSLYRVSLSIALSHGW